MQRSIHIASGVLALTLLLAPMACKKKHPPVPKGDMSASLALPLLYGGQQFDPKVLAGKKVIVNFWSPK